MLSAKGSFFEASVSPIYQTHYYLLPMSVYDQRWNCRQEMWTGQQIKAQKESYQSLARSVEKLLGGSEADLIKF